MKENGCGDQFSILFILFSDPLERFCFFPLVSTILSLTTTDNHGNRPFVVVVYIYYIKFSSRSYSVHLFKLENGNRNNIPRCGTPKENSLQD